MPRNSFARGHTLREKEDRNRIPTGVCRLRNLALSRSGGDAAAAPHRHRVPRLISDAAGVPATRPRAIRRARPLPGGHHELTRGARNYRGWLFVLKIEWHGNEMWTNTFLTVTQIKKCETVVNAIYYRCANLFPLTSNKKIT